MKKIIALLLCSVLALGLFGCNKTPEVDVPLKEGTVYYADIDIVDYGTITVELDQEAAPITVQNFVNLAASGFYTGLKFHRIIEGFMMQGGAPKADSPEVMPIVGEFEANGIASVPESVYNLMKDADARVEKLLAPKQEVSE